MKASIYCPGCKEKLRKTVLEVTVISRQGEYRDAWCPVCVQPFSGIVIPVHSEEWEAPTRV